MTHTQVNFSEGSDETVLPSASEDLVRQLTEALVPDNTQRREALQKVVMAQPTFLDAWARLSEVGRDPVERYAYARIGYHRGLDALRKSGWRGSGYVRWRHGSNRGFLRSLELLRSAAVEIGEADEAERCALFLRQLDPDWASVDIG